jgi:insecticidal toxin complex protein TccC
MSHALHAHTPLVTAVDGRGLTVRITEYRKLQDQEAALALTSRMAYDTAGRLVALWDPRLWALAEQNATSPANRTYRHSLASVPLLSESVDAGWELALSGEAGNLVESWDTRGSTRRIRYDPYLRPVATVEIDARQNARTIIRSVYADNSEESARHNQCGQLARLDDTAGALHFPDYGVLGQLLSQPRQFLKTPDLPDWTDETDYQDLVETEAFTTHWQYNAAGQPTLQTDARGNARRAAYSVAGGLSGVYLRLNAQDETTLVDGMVYDAFGQVEAQTAGNGVVSRSVYDVSTGLLQSLTAGRPGTDALQALHYQYDPAGNVLQIEDSAQPVRFFANQRIEPIGRYRYDTLYQLVEATGREVNTGASHGPALPVMQNLPTDPNQVSNYTQSYDYDIAGNLLQMRHVGAQSFTRTMRVAPDSNRSLPEAEVDVDFDAAFDANGNQLQLFRGQTLEWDLRNQLQQITTVTRPAAANDSERYIYEGQGQRCRKISSAQTASRTLSNEVRYLPGLEIRTTADGEILHVITAQAGRSSVRVLHWQAGQPGGIANDQVRYSLDDHLGSSTLELDHQGGLISQEGYYPFGGTAWWAARSAVEARYKTVRYSGKERDAGGLYYYGFRYYAPWLQRWISPDPAGDIAGLNLYQMLGNNPVCRMDLDGRMDSARQADSKDAKRKLIHNVVVHLSALKLTKERVKAAIQQIKNHLDYQERGISVAKRSAAQVGEAAAKTAGSTGGAVAGAATVGAIACAACGPAGMAAGGVAVLGGLAAGAASSYVAKKAAGKLEWNASINLKASALDPFQIMKEASETAHSLRGTVMHTVREYADFRTAKARQEASKSIAGSALGQIPVVGTFIRSAPEFAELAYETFQSENQIQPEKWEHLGANLDALEEALKKNLDDLKQEFGASGLATVEVSIFKSEKSFESLHKATTKVIDLIHSAREWASIARSPSRKNSQLLVTRL